MGEQIRAEDWLPEGWKVEIRVRKSGKKDRYYIDPTNGYIFRSLKDIDRYLLTGKLGRHVTKTKPKDLDNSFAKPDMKPLSLKEDVSKKKKSPKSNGMKKSSQAAQGRQSAGGDSSQKSSAKGSKKEETGAENPKEATKKTISRPSKGRISKPSRKREATPFFILDPDQCEEGTAASIPNLSEIIDSMQKEREGHNTVYISAPAIGALLGGQWPQAGANRDNIKQRPQFSLTLCKGYTPNFPSLFSTVHLKKEPPESKTIISPNLDPSPDPEKSSSMVDMKSTRIVDIESKDKKEQGIPPVFGDLLTDPCIDFAIKTLTGAIPLGSEPTAEDCYFQQQLGSSMVLN